MGLLLAYSKLWRCSEGRNSDSWKSVLGCRGNPAKFGVTPDFLSAPRTMPSTQRHPNGTLSFPIRSTYSPSRPSPVQNKIGTLVQKDSGRFSSALSDWKTAQAPPAVLPSKPRGSRTLSAQLRSLSKLVSTARTSIQIQSRQSLSATPGPGIGTPHGGPPLRESVL